MRQFFLVSFVALVGVLACVARAEGAEKAQKPVVCLSYEVVKPDLAVCSDSKKPFIMRSFDEMRSSRPDGTIVNVLVGWR